MFKHRFLPLFIIHYSLFMISLLACSLISNTTPAPLPTSPTPTTPATIPPPTATIPPPATATPLPTNTPDPKLADWTFLIYMAADNNLETQSLFDINEMENAGNSKFINILVQVDRVEGESDLDGDWTGTRRYRIKGDDDLDTINAELLADLGETNTGDPAHLADFLQWGIEEYPANHYALILWNHGAGWEGIAYDDSTPDDDGLTLAEINTALDNALTTTALSTFDIIGFDACLMGQLDVYQAIQPYTRYAVASEELVPGYGWDYADLFADLYQTPDLPANLVAQRMVSHFNDYYTTIEPDDFTTMAVIDMHTLPAVTTALQQLADLLTADPTLAASAIGDARAGAETYAQYYPDDVEYYAAIDLHHFAGILAQRSPNDDIRTAAQNVMTAIEATVLYQENGTGLRHSQGVAIYFPRTSDFWQDTYAQSSPLPAWQNFLTTYYNLGLTDIPIPEFNIVNLFNENAGIHQPAYMDVEIIGRDIENVYLIGGHYQENRLRLLEYDYLIPEPTILPDGTELYEWRDGVHEDFFVWYTDATYISDGTQGDFAVMFPTDYDSSLYVVEGRYRRATERKYFDANLVFDTDTGELVSIWSFQGSSGSAPREILPATGDEFQLYQHYLDNLQDRFTFREAGTSLFFNDAQPLTFDWRPLPSGSYFLGFSAETIAGQSTDAFRRLTVDNDNALDGFLTYLDPYRGFQFRYPADWFQPAYEETNLYSGNSDTFFTLTPFPYLTVTSADLKAQTLQDFGAVDVLFEDTTTIAGNPALRTFYAYTDADDQDRLGIFLTFIHEDTGYVIDLDAPATAQAQTTATLDQLITSWQFLPIGFGQTPGNWATVNLSNFSVAKPDDFTTQERGGWQILTAPDDISFVALRTDSHTNTPIQTLVDQWLAVARADVAQFNAQPPFTLALANKTWTRANFAYTNEDGEEIWGFLMLTIENGQEIVAWAEAPAGIFNDIERTSFLPIVADLTLNP